MELPGTQYTLTLATQLRDNLIKDIADVQASIAAAKAAGDTGIVVMLVNERTDLEKKLVDANTTIQSVASKIAAATAGDASTTKKTTAGTTPVSGDDAAGPTSIATTAASVDAPGGRDYNPLSKLSSYTYNIALYMITPEDYVKFVETGQADTSNFTTVCQSGGSTKTKDGPFPLDYYIDDLTFKTFCSTKTNDGPVVDSVNFEFKIYEPYGFSFVSQLKAAALDVINKSNLTGIKQATHHMQQHYMLGIKFYGYDAQGAIAAGNQFGLDKTNDGALFPRYFPIYLTHLTFKLDGKATTYSIKAQSISMNVAAGQIRSVIKNHMSVKGSTVAEILAGTSNYSLMGMMNAQEQELTNANPGNQLIKQPNKYVIKFVGPNSDAIANAVLVNPSDIPKYKSELNNNAKTSDSTDKKALGLTFNKNTQSYEVTAGSTIIQAIDNIISQSSYISKSLKSLQTESDAGNKVQTNPDPKPLSWYIIVPIVKPIAYDDDKRFALAYEITYQIKEYLVPYVRSAYVSKTTQYHGAHKKYNYIYTGNNNEIINYEQTYNALYYMSSLRQTADNTWPPVEYNMNARQAEDTGGTNNLGGQAAASIKTSLYSPGDKALAKMSILGDPDYLMTTMGMEYQVYKKFYGEDYSINAQAGQVFIEINFNEATDYDNKTGLMSINDRVEVYRYPPDLKIEGISYIVTDVNSTFSRGRFTQELNLVLWSPPFSAEVSNSVNSSGSSITETNRSVIAAITKGATKQTDSSASVVGFTQSTPVAGTNSLRLASQKTAASSLPGLQSGSGTLGTSSAGKQTADDDNSTTVADAQGYSPRSSFTI